MSSSNNCQTSCCTCSDLFITCLHFCLAPWYLCTCKSFFDICYLINNFIISSCSCPSSSSCWSSWLQSSDQRRDGGGDPHTRQESTASSPQKENSLFSAYIHFELLLWLESMHLMCVRCVQRLERLPTLAALGKGQGELQGEKWSPLSSYQSLTIIYNIYCKYQLTDTTVDPSLVHFNLWGICKHFNQWTSASF